MRARDDYLPEAFNLLQTLAIELCISPKAQTSENWRRFVIYTSCMQLNLRQLFNFH